MRSSELSFQRCRSIHRQALGRAAGVPPSDVVAAPVAGAGAGAASPAGPSGGGLTLLTRVTFASSCPTAAACDAAARGFAAQVDALLEAPIIEKLNLKVAAAPDQCAQSQWPLQCYCSAGCLRRLVMQAAVALCACIDRSASKFY